MVPIPLGNRPNTPELLPGNKPIATVAMPMINKVHTRVRLRPIKSPKCPNKIAPTGRAKNATAKVAKDANVAIELDIPEKKMVGKTSAAAVP